MHLKQYIPRYGIPILCTAFIFSVINSARGQQIMEWPALTEFSFVSGRAATEEDVNAGSAVFVLKVDGKPVGIPINIKLPQYAIHVDSESGGKTKVVVLQAEEADGNQYFGAVDILEGTYLLGFANEFDLLGEKPKFE